MKFDQAPWNLPPRASLASDNASGVHPQVLEALARCNGGHQPSYGDDGYTRAAQAAFDQLFGRPVGLLFAPSGTGANLLALSGLISFGGGVVCAQTAHLVDDEAGAPERLLGAKLLTLPTPDGKLTPERIEPCLAAVGSRHHVQPQAVAIAQLTETGLCYTPEEVRALSAFCHGHGLSLFMDGARLANACCTLDASVAQLTQGVDVLVFGGAKNGLMFGEALVCLNQEAWPRYQYLHKQLGQLCSKTRYIASQYLAYLADGLYLANARQANRAAAQLAGGLRAQPGAHLLFPVQGNLVFAQLPQQAIAPLSAQWGLHPACGGTRMVTSFDTAPETVTAFLRQLREASGR